MGYAPVYARFTSFETWQAAHPGVVYVGTDLDSEFEAARTTINAINANLKLIQRSDGKLANASVGTDQIDATLTAIMGGFNPRGAWATSTSYAVKDLVSNSGSSYVCAVAHTGGTFATDLAAGKWILVAGAGGASASSVSFSPTGTLSSTDVQAAIAEAASEAQPLNAILTALAALSPAADKLGYFTGASAWALADFNAQGRSLVGAASKAAARAVIDAVTGPASTTQHSLAMWDTGTLTLKDGPALGVAGQVMTSNGAGVAPSFQNAAGATMTRRTITGADTLATTDRGNIVEATSGTFTLAASAVATLTNGWYCIVRNSGTGVVTIDPNGAETIDGVSTLALNPGDSRLIECNGSALVSVLLGAGSTVLQTVAATPYTSNTDITTAIPADDTIPQNTEGVQILTLTIKPISASSKIRLRFRGFGMAAAGDSLSAALFVDSTANALNAVNFKNGNNLSCALHIEHDHSPGDTASHTYNIRVGGSTASAARMNGTPTARLFGGVASCTLVAEEIL
jgi:hypothetical protein